MRDISIFESGAGGEIAMNTNDVRMTGSVYNQVYLAWFGGNVEQDRDENDNDTIEERKSYWQNSLFYPNDIDNQLVSRTERALGNLAMTTQGVYELEQLALSDVQFLSEFGEISVNAEVEGYDKIKLHFTLTEPSNAPTNIVFVYDKTKNEIIENKVI